MSAKLRWPRPATARSFSMWLGPDAGPAGFGVASGTGAFWVRLAFVAQGLAFLFMGTGLRSRGDRQGKLNLAV